MGFDPFKVSEPVSFPIETLEELESRSYFDYYHFPFSVSSVSLSSSSSSSRPRLLVCHDMKNGYLDDKWIQGGDNENAYAIWHWYLIDIFVYFSHHLVTIPPPCWINTAHAHGVKVLGTFITEWKQGEEICNILLSTKESAHMYAERLTQLAATLGFDGWLINIENELKQTQIPNLKEFISHLTQTMHLSSPGSLVIWYDSVTEDGKLSWQDQLNEKNKPFFDLCDGIFVNYTWKEEYLEKSVLIAKERKFDVYMGIDVFGRNTFGGGEWKTNVALNAIKNSSVSAAIFAPGWVYETEQPPDFQTAQNCWWHLVEKSWGIYKSYPNKLPFYSDFDQGHGHNVSINGNQVSSKPWCNISCQSFQPFLCPRNHGNSIHSFYNFQESSYNGGCNITFQGSLNDNALFMTKLFSGNVVLGDRPLHILYSVKNLDGSSLLGLALQFSSESHVRKLVLLSLELPTSFLWKDKFDETKLLHIQESSNEDQNKEWSLLECTIYMSKNILTDISTVCYKKSTNIDSSLSFSSDYYASLGHIAIRDTDKMMIFPLQSSWKIEAPFKELGMDNNGNRTLSTKIVWNLLGQNVEETYSMFLRYNIYVKKLLDQATDMEDEEYVGVAMTRAFHVSDMVVPKETLEVKYIIQVCGLDGSFQALMESPSILLDIRN